MELLVNMWFSWSITNSRRSSTQSNWVVEILTTLRLYMWSFLSAIWGQIKTQFVKILKCYTFMNFLTLRVKNMSSVGPTLCAIRAKLDPSLCSISWAVFWPKGSFSKRKPPVGRYICTRSKNRVLSMIIRSKVLARISSVMYVVNDADSMHTRLTLLLANLATIPSLISSLKTV